MSVEKPLVWVGSSKKDFDEFPEKVASTFGYALYLAQCGDKPPEAKPMKGFGGASVLELVENFDGDAYRAVYTVRFEDAVYVLHCFQKKSRSGISTPRTDIERIERRLRTAQEEHERWKAKQTR